jgi:protein tyrosine phosphatase (PTP) superfamily phosphohydrolase (DUF442 family)
MSTFDGIRQLMQVTHRITTAGQPTLEQLEAVADQGYAVVINLGQHDAVSALEDEANWVTQLGMDYVHVPVNFTAPQLADLTRFLNAMNLNQGQKCFVHSSGNKRASVFVSLYQIIANEMTPEEGWLHVNSVWEPDIVWTKFFNDAINAFANVIRADN